MAITMNEKRLGSVVQQARRLHGLTQQELCQKTGLSYSTLAKIERGAIKAPSVFTIQTIARTLGVSLDSLMESAFPVNKLRKMVSKNGVRFVYFDMNGCLVRFYTRAFARLAEDAGVTPDVVETIFWQYNDDVCRGTKSIDELNTALAEKLNMMVDWNKYYLSAVEATPQMNEVVSWVSERYQVGILTNTMPNIVQPLLESGILPKITYDAIIDSSDVGYIKPEQHIFEIATAAAGIAPEEILLVDDDRPNLVAAGKMGWHTLSFDSYRPDESIANIKATLAPTE